MNYFKISKTTNQYLIFNKKTIVITQVTEGTDIKNLIETQGYENPTKMSYTDLKDITFIDTDYSITLNFKNEKTDEIEVTTSATEYDNTKLFVLSNFKGVEIKEYSIFKQATPGLIGLLLSGLFTFITYSAAKALQHGEQVSTSGRRGWFKKIIVWVADLLGPTGTLVVGGLILVFFAYTLFKTISKPKTGKVIKIKKHPELKV